MKLQLLSTEPHQTENLFNLTQEIYEEYKIFSYDSAYGYALRKAAVKYHYAFLHYNPTITAFYKKVIFFRNTSSALKTGSLAMYSSDDVCVFKRTAGTEKILVVVNLRNMPVTYLISSDLQNSSWQDAFLRGVR